jgi:hypothetical protein
MGGLVARRALSQVLIGNRKGEEHAFFPFPLLSVRLHVLKCSLDGWAPRGQPRFREAEGVTGTAVTENFTLQVSGYLS